METQANPRPLLFTCPYYTHIVRVGRIGHGRDDFTHIGHVCGVGADDV